ncbi:MAG: SDR family oxidoreductase [Notoacmeibacter sp.]|nr:SDR family oxidoreductase [Notoacmeibacter sp.]
MTDSSWLGLEGKVAAVTGAAGGIGKAIATSLAAAGARVAVIDLDGQAAERVAAEIRASGHEAAGFACDVGKAESVSIMADAVSRALGPADILVNNAAILRPGSLETLPLADWEAMLRVNLTGYLACAQTFGAAMLRRGEGAIVHIASISGQNPQPHSGAYSAGKAAITMMSRQLAFEWGPRGVRSNCVSPGMIRTPLSEEFYTDEMLKARREKVIPARRIGRPQDIADAVLFLASARASYVNGQDLLVDGGYAQTLMAHVPRPGYED